MAASATLAQKFMALVQGQAPRRLQEGEASAQEEQAIHQEADRFMTELAIYCGMSAFICLLCFAAMLMAGRRRKAGVGKGSPSKLNKIFNLWYVRGMLSLLMVLFFLMPVIVMISCSLFGLLLSLVEGWSAMDGILYLTQFAMALQNPLTFVAPENYFGMAMDLLIGVWNMLVVATATGLATKMLLVTNISGQAPQTVVGFLRYLFVYVPIVVLLVSLLSGSVIAAVEGWAYIDGVFYMAGDGVGIEVSTVSPVTTLGHVVECIFQMAEIGFVAGIFGLVADHPLTESFVAFLEGEPEEEGAGEAGEDEAGAAKQAEAAAALSVAELEQVATEQQLAVLKAQEDLDRTQKLIFMKKEQVLQTGTYMIIASEAKVAAGAAGAGTDDAAVATLLAGARVKVEEVVSSPGGDGDVCARIASPEGWVTLRGGGGGVTAIPDFPIADSGTAVQVV